MNKKIKTVLDSIVERFEGGEVPEAITLTMFPALDIPMKEWSLLNRLIVFFSGTRDARGIRQWNKAGRKVIKGRKAIHILAPSMKRIKEDDTEEKKPILKGFLAIPVFRVEDTDGDDIVYPELNLPEFPLIDRAKEWGINIKAVEGNTDYYGYYSPSREEIAIAAPAECVFFHELAHAAHKRIKGNLKSGQDALQEIVAELSAIALGRLVGKDTRDYFGNSYRYISSYANKLDMTPYSACMKVISDTEKVLNLTLGMEGV